MLRSPILVALTIVYIVSTASAVPTISLVVKEGDVVPGVGAISSGTAAIDNLAVNNNGEWLVEADTTQADTNTDTVLMRGIGHAAGSLNMREGQALTSPAGASLDTFDAINLNNNGNSGWNFFLSGTAGTAFDSGIYYNADLVIQESYISTAAGFSANTKYIGWFEARINNNNDIMMIASVDDPAIASTVDRALVKINPLTLAETVYVKEGDQLLPGRLLVDVSTGPHDSVWNDNGVVLYAADMDGDTNTDDIIVKSNGLGHSIVAQQGQPVAAVAGRNWGTLAGTSLDMNGNGDWVGILDMDGVATDDLAIIRNGSDVIAREGSSLPSIGGVFTFTGFGTGAVQIASNGDVAWFGDWNDADTTRDTGIFLNGDLLVQEGVTTVGGVTIQSIASGQDNFTMSDDGRWIMFEGTLANGLDGAFLMEVPEPATVSILLAGGLMLASRRRRGR